MYCSVWLAVLLLGAPLAAVNGGNDEAMKKEDVSPVDGDANAEVSEENSVLEDPGDSDEDGMELDDNTENNPEDNAEKDGGNPGQENDPFIGSLSEDLASDVGVEQEKNIFLQMLNRFLPPPSAMVQEMNRRCLTSAEQKTC
eukprot:Seg961.3 transcript_id=Seg961.3/GoldUCD/mRNA.D3Y31 product="hypothetical protein" protein_id=Seg961.3/GoldUCD/D3Y31